MWSFSEIGHCRCNGLRWGHIGKGWSPNQIWMVSLWKGRFGHTCTHTHVHMGRTAHEDGGRDRGEVSMMMASKALEARADSPSQPQKKWALPTPWIRTSASRTMRQYTCLNHWVYGLLFPWSCLGILGMENVIAHPSGVNHHERPHKWEDQHSSPSLTMEALWPSKSHNSRGTAPSSQNKGRPCTPRPPSLSLPLPVRSSLVSKGYFWGHQATASSRSCVRHSLRQGL